jgi:hypothetical protein
MGIYADRSVALAIAWARIAPQLGASFILPPGWEEDVGYLSLDNRVRAALGVSSDREAEERLLARIKVNKAGTLVRLQIQIEQLQTALALIDDQGLSGTVKRLLMTALVAAVSTVSIGALSIPTATLLELVDEGREALLRDYLDATRQELAARLRRRGVSGASPASSTSTDDRPAAFGTKN